MRFEPCDIVVLESKFGARIYAIVDASPLAPEYSGVRLDKAPFTRRYRFGDQDVLTKIGKLDTAALALRPDPPKVVSDTEWQAGQLYAQYMAKEAASEIDRRRWRLLAGLKPGNCVPIIRLTARKIKVEHHRFQAVLPGDLKHQFLATNANGTTYRWMLNAVWLDREPPSAADQPDLKLVEFEEHGTGQVISGQQD
jgi:hypothetical protein